MQINFSYCKDLKDIFSDRYVEHDYHIGYLDRGPFPALKRGNNAFHGMHTVSGPTVIPSGSVPERLLVVEIHTSAEKRSIEISTAPTPSWPQDWYQRLHRNILATGKRHVSREELAQTPHSCITRKKY